MENECIVSILILKKLRLKNNTEKVVIKIGVFTIYLQNIT